MKAGATVDRAVSVVVEECFVLLATAQSIGIDDPHVRGILAALVEANRRGLITSEAHRAVLAGIERAANALMN